MIIHRFALVALLFATVAGCRNDAYKSAYMETLRAEKLWIEDQYYALESQYNEKVAALASASDENNSLRTRLGMNEQTPAPSTGGSSLLAKPAPNSNPVDLSAPTIEIGTPLDSGPGSLERLSADLSEGTLHQVIFPEDGQLHRVSERRVPIDRRVTHMVLNPHLTGGRDFDRSSGDDGITVVVEPRNADNVFVPIAGPISIVLLDPMLAGEAARVARWEIDQDEVEERLQLGMLQRTGITLNLPWPSGPPKNSDLHLFVRYVTPQGEKLKADAELSILLPGQVASRWTPKSSKRNHQVESVSEAIQDNFKQRGTNISLAMPDEHVMQASTYSNPSPTSPVESTAVDTSAQQRPQWRPFR